MLDDSEKSCGTTIKAGIGNSIDLDSAGKQSAEEESSRSEQPNRWEEFEARRSQNPVITRHETASL